MVTLLAVNCYRMSTSVMSDRYPRNKFIQYLYINEPHSNEPFHFFITLLEIYFQFFFFFFDVFLFVHRYLVNVSLLFVFLSRIKIVNYSKRKSRRFPPINNTICCGRTNCNGVFQSLTVQPTDSRRKLFRQIATAAEVV